MPPTCLISQHRELHPLLVRETFVVYARFSESVGLTLLQMLLVWMFSGIGDGNKARCSMVLVDVTGSRVCRFDKKEGASFFLSQ